MSRTSTSPDDTPKADVRSDATPDRSSREEKAVGVNDDFYAHAVDMPNDPDAGKSDAEKSKIVSATRFHNARSLT